jgi:glycosyltransferase involved in cell wall biosynthesis
VDTDGLSPRPAPARFTVGYFARIAPEKGLHLLAEAYRLLRAEGRLAGARLEAAGYLAPEHRTYLRGIEARLEQAGSEFASRDPRSGGKIDPARLTCLGAESLRGPRAALEAMACGVPVVQPRHGAFPEILERTGGGVLFEPGDVKGLADAILSLHDDAPRAAELGQRGAEGVARHFGVRLMAERVLEIWQGLRAA